MRRLIPLALAAALIAVGVHAWAMWGTKSGTSTTQAISIVQVAPAGTANSSVGFNAINIGGPNLLTRGGVQYLCYYDTASPPNLKFLTRNLATGAVAFYSPTGLPPLADANVHRICAIGIDVNGIIHISYGLYYQNGLNIYHSTSALNPSAFTASTTPGGGTGVELDAIYPYMTANPTSGELYLIWMNQVNGGVNNAQEYLYHWNTGTTQWEVAAGTGTGGIFYNGSANSPTTGLYLNGLPKWDHTGVLWVSYEEMQGIVDSLANQYFVGWNGSGWVKVGGATQAIPITQANETISVTIPAGSGLMAQNDFAVGPNGALYVAYQRNDANNHTQIWEADNATGSFVEHKLTNYVGQPCNVTLTGCETQAVVKIDTAGNLYVIFSDTKIMTSAPMGLVMIKTRDKFAHWTAAPLISRYTPNFVLEADPVQQARGVISFLLMDENDAQYAFHYPFANPGQMSIAYWLLPTSPPVPTGVAFGTNPVSISDTAALHTMVTPFTVNMSDGSTYQSTPAVQSCSQTPCPFGITGGVGNWSLQTVISPPLTDVSNATLVVNAP